MKKLTLSVAALTIAMMSYSQTQCKGLTKDSVQCKNMSNAELYQMWKQLQAKQEIDKFINKLAKKNGTTNY